MSKDATAVIEVVLIFVMPLLAAAGAHSDPDQANTCPLVAPACVSVDGACVWLDGQVETAEFLGEFSRYRVRVGEVALISDQPHYAGIVMFEPGSHVRLGIEPTQLRYLSH